MPAEDDARDRLGGEEGGLRALRDQVLLRVGLGERELTLRERGAQRHVGEEFEHFVREGRERGGGDRGVVRGRAGVEGRAEARDLLGDLPAGARLGPLEEHSRERVGQAGQFRRVEGVARAQREPEADERQAVLLDGDDGEAVLKRRLAG